MDVTHMDPRTAKLAIELQLADIQDLLESLYEELPNGDERTSFELLREDLQRQLQILEGQVLTLIILEEEHENRVAFARLMQEERQAVADHQLAQRFAKIEGEEPELASDTDTDPSLGEEKTHDDVDEQWEMAKELYASAFQDGTLTIGDDWDTKDQEDNANETNGLSDFQKSIFCKFSPQKQAKSNKHDLLVKEPLNGLSNVKETTNILGSSAFTRCNACMEVVTTKNTLRLQCKPERHIYCRTCLTVLFENAITDTSLFPPRCCKVAVPLGTCRALLCSSLIKEFDLKVEEMASPNPTYCSNLECGQFIRLKDIRANVGKCRFCEERTCVSCKSAEHEGLLCPSDPHVQLLMDVAKRSKWQECGRCKNLVELVQGCYHMVCRCRYEFCYLCGAKWKSCTCPHAGEEYITPDVQMIDAPINNLAVRPDCEHQLQRHNGGVCQECQAAHLPWAMRCRLCDYITCWRCFNNRR